MQLKDGPAERYEQWVNTPVYTRDYEDCVGWLGCELPEDGHSCEFAELAGDGAVTCTSSSEVNRLRDENEKLRRFVTIRNHCIAGGCDLCQYRKNRESEDIECELDDLKRELGI